MSEDKKKKNPFGNLGSVIKKGTSQENMRKAEAEVKRNANVVKLKKLRKISNEGN